MNVRTRLAALCAAALFAGCNGSTPLPNAAAGSVPSSSVAANGHHRPAELRLRILVPKKHKRHDHFISPATVAMTVRLTGGPSKFDGLFVLTPSLESKCSYTLAGVLCSFSFLLLPGNYVADVSTYDAVQCKNGRCRIPPRANELSTGQSVAVPILEGVLNNANITLSGIASTLTMVPANAMSVADNGGYDLLGLGVHPFLIEALDADGNAIVGPGSPAYVVSETGGNVSVAIAGPRAYSPNSLTLTPPSMFTAGGFADLKIAARYPAGVTNACNFGGVCSATVTVNERELLVGNATTGTVTGYPAGSGTPILTLPGSGPAPSAITSDAGGNVYVAYVTGTNGSVEEFPAGGAAASRTIATGVHQPCCIAVDPTTLDVFVANTHADTVTIYTPSASSPVTTLNYTAPVAMLEDSAANLLTGGNADTVYVSPPYTGTQNAISPGGAPCPVSGNVATALALDASGNLFVASSFGGGIICSWPNTANGYSGSATNVAAPGSGLSDSIAVDASDDVYALYTSGNNVMVYEPPYVGGNPSYTISDGIDSPTHLALDAAGNLYVANAGSSAVTVYAPGSAEPLMTVTDAVSGPSVVYVEP
jgi:sugar lactone lactonase YvrE